MKPIKMLGIAALTALTMLAFVGSGTAMAESTALCDLDPGEKPMEPCPAGHLISHVHKATATGEKAKLLTSPEVQCDVLFLGDVKSSSNLGNPLVIEGGYTFSNCGSGCTVTELNGPMTLNVLKEGHELAKTTTGTGTGAGLFDVKNCFGLDCVYVMSGLVSHSLGPLLSKEEEGDESLVEQSLAHESGFFCPNSTKFDIRMLPLTATSFTN